MKIIITILISMSLLNLASCRLGLEDLPVFDEADIISVSFETRWVDTVTGVFKAQALTVSEYVMDNIAGTISCKLTVPAASNNFPAEIHNTVVLNKLLMYCKLSNAATVKPLGNTPVMGTIGDYSQSNLQYEVTAANGKTKKIWTIIITGFIK
ncbi:MAG: hypothetical protein Q8T08_25735 [Ignavibacteria bacterium]|nr:hypothetical protein [Ignavibacteria bacterium]